MALKTGKRPAVYKPKNFQFATYRKPVKRILRATSALHVPSHFGHAGSYTNFGPLGNDAYGDCVFAGGDNETALLNRIVGRPLPGFTANTALADYSAVTGFDPSKTDANGNNPTDQGTIVHDALEYRRKTGLVDVHGKRHTIAAYVSLEPGNLQHLLEALYLFDVVGIGINFPGSAMDQFNAYQPWSVVAGAAIDGGHYVPLVGRPNPGTLKCVTWARVQQMTDTFFSTYCDEAYAYITTEALNAKTNRNAEGFDWAALKADLAALPPTR